MAENSEGAGRGIRGGVTGNSEDVRQGIREERGGDGGGRGDSVGGGDKAAAAGLHLRQNSAVESSVDVLSLKWYRFLLLCITL